MDFKNLLPATNRDELRQWLSENHNKEDECWVVVKRGRPVDNGTFWYIDAVEEAMCFGWIDSTTKKMDNGITAQRLAPRRKGSVWSELNKERCRRMERLGRMTDAGRAVLPDMSESGFVIDKDILMALQADSEIWENFQSFPPLYQRVRVDTIQIKKKQPDFPFGIVTIVRPIQIFKIKYPLPTSGASSRKSFKGFLLFLYHFSERSDSMSEVLLILLHNRQRYQHHLRATRNNFEIEDGVKL